MLTKRKIKNTTKKVLWSHYVLTLAIEKKMKITKNPDVQTNFLPDKQREELEKQEIENLTKEWKAEQEKIKGIAYILCSTLTI
jgi:hypothetical protein